MLGYDEHELIGRNAFELYHPDEAQHFRNRLKEVLKGSGSEKIFTHRFKRKDGSYCVLETIADHRIETGQIRGIVLNSRDITDSELISVALSFLAVSEKAMLS